MDNNIDNEDDWGEVDWDDDDREEEENWDSDDWKGENLDYYEDIDELIDSIVPCELLYWEDLFRSFLSKSTMYQEAYDVTDNIQMARQKGNVFIYINNQLLDLCVFVLLRKICERQGDILAISQFYSAHKYSMYIKEIEDFFRLGLEVQSSESFKLLCCELKQWVESGYRTKLRNPKLAPAILNQLKNKI